MPSLDFLQDLDIIIPFKDKVIELRKKYNFPKTYDEIDPTKLSDLSKQCDHLPKMSDEFYIEFTHLTDEIVDYLKITFPYEILEISRETFNNFNEWIIRENKNRTPPNVNWYCEHSGKAWVMRLTLIRAFDMCKPAKVIFKEFNIILKKKDEEINNLNLIIGKTELDNETEQHKLLQTIKELERINANEKSRLKLELEKQKEYYENRERKIVELLNVDINKL
jgi:hypothetical protein